MNIFGKNLALWIIIALLLVALFNLFQTSSSRGPQTNVAYSDFLSMVQNGQVKDVVIQGSAIHGHYTSGGAFATYAPPNDVGLVDQLRKAGVQFSAAPTEDNVPSLFSILVSWQSQHHRRPFLERDGASGGEVTRSFRGDRFGHGTTRWNRA